MIDHALEKAIGVALAVIFRERSITEIKNVAQRCGSLGVEPVVMLEECVLLDVLVAVASTAPDGKDACAHESPLLVGCWERIGAHAERYKTRERGSRQ